jgi:hypothetical protein
MLLTSPGEDLATLRKAAYSGKEAGLSAAIAFLLAPIDNDPVQRSGFGHACRKLLGGRALAAILATMVLIVASIVLGSGSAVAVEVGQPAPEFKLPSSTGNDVSLADFRGKKWVLLEFYGADFVPT